MRAVKIKDIAKVVSGATPRRDMPEYWGGKIPWVSLKEISGLKSPYLYDSLEKISSLGYQSCSTEMLPIGSVLLSSRAPIGLLAINKIPVCTNQGFKSLIPKEGIIAEYLFYYLKHNIRHLQARGTGAVFTELSKAAVEEFDIQIPSFDDQFRIVYLLSRIENLIARRKVHLQESDDLLKSVFLSMFGDPVKNERNWSKYSFAEFSDSRLGKMRDKKFITGENTRKYIGNSNVRWFEFDLSSLQEMDFDESERLKFSLKYGDLLICEGGEIGRCAIWKEEIKDCYYQKALHRVRLNSEIALPEYVQYVLFCLSVSNGFKNVSGKSTIQHLTGEKLKETFIPMPPIELQESFAFIYSQIEHLKQSYLNSLVELENLYGVLSQRAFKGELDLSRVPLQDGEPETVATSGELQSSPFEDGLPDLPGIVADLNAFNTGIQAIGPELAALRASSAQMEVMNLLLEVSSPAEQWRRLPRMVAALQNDASTQDMPAVAEALAAGQAALDKAQGLHITALPGAEALFYAMQETFRDAQQKFPLYLGHTETSEPAEALQEPQSAPEDIESQDNGALDEPVIFTKEQVLEVVGIIEARELLHKLVGIPTIKEPYSTKEILRHLAPAVVVQSKSYESLKSAVYELLASGELVQALNQETKVLELRVRQ